MAKGERYIPAASPETAHFWSAAREGRLVLQRCEDCDHVYFPPRPFCAKCNSRNVVIQEASGRATLYSYVISQRPAPGFDAPYAIAVVTLEEGPRMMTNIVDIAQTPEALVLDMPLRVKFHKLTDDISLPLFGPDGAAS